MKSHPPAAAALAGATAVGASCPSPHAKRPPEARRERQKADAGLVLARRREAVMRSLERNVRACRKAGNLSGERQGLALLARLLGMVPQAAPVAVAVAGANTRPMTIVFRSNLPDEDGSYPEFSRDGPRAHT
jgi:hypothetical protein